MDVFDAIRGRKSIRKFRPTPVDDGDLKKILGAGISAPSAGNCQPWEFVIVKDVEIKQRLTDAAHGQSSLAQAPVVIVVCAKPSRSASRYGKRGEDLYCLQDTAAAVQNIHLAAYALDYGTCWVGAFEENAVTKAIKAPSDVRPMAMIPIGRPSEKPDPKSRLPLNTISRAETF
ncbi:MAG: nitroreductase family protein [Methanobacteriota archaeon]